MDYTIEFSEEEKEKLHYERFHHPHPRVMLKMEVVWLKSQGKKHKEISQIANVCENTVRQYLSEYIKDGIEKLKEVNFHGTKSALSEHMESLGNYFKQNPPRNSQEAANRIEELTGIKLSDERIRMFLKQIGMKYIKMGFIPGKADKDLQEEF